jgi:nicotinate-nucleotide pyrophosphorylase (carboxylating)
MRMNSPRDFQPQLDRLIRMALAEDVGSGDRTTGMLIDPGIRGKARIVARQPLIAAGTHAFLRVFAVLSHEVVCTGIVRDGEEVDSGSVLAELQGPYAALLTGERTALNFLQRLSGIATATRRLVRCMQDFSAELLDTRKTTPGWRILEKEAVRAGGGRNHRMGLYDAVLIKENHIAACGGIGAALRTVRRCKGPHLTVEIEVRNLAEFREALVCGPDMIMLDNMSCDDIRQAVTEAGDTVALEASGTITPETIRAVAATGVGYISSGYITHSAPAVDVSMLIDQES